MKKPVTIAAKRIPSGFKEPKAKITQPIITPTTFDTEDLTRALEFAPATKNDVVPTNPSHGANKSGLVIDSLIATYVQIPQRMPLATALAPIFS